MDEELAALLAGAIGLAGAVLGAAVGGLASYRAAKRSAEVAARALAEQVAGQARYEQEQWVRQERRQVYGDINRAYAELAAALAALHTALSRRRPVQELVERVEERRLQLSVAVSPTAMLGPVEVHDAARALIGATDAFVAAYRELAVPPEAHEQAQPDAVRECVADRRADVHACLSNFSTACRNVLLRQGDS
ncbi:hypothetical protein [Streptomyces paromomycinus]|uniref:Uncharacterized protein n=1 Tax=Streptomyces paromomycinus TaxID=92743 RepID=A0A401WES9_STREY|nr:hypothetical protein [Streptomyces paromomycinus]GCD47865.1 hypothetical protein GKJPGBOP_07659 [Streptomyces paromomycinus]